MSLTRKLGERKGKLPLLDVDHPPPATLIKEFYSNLSVHFYNYTTQVKSWIWGEEYTITPTVMASTLGVSMVQHPVYPYDESPPLDDIMSYLIGSSIQCGSDPRITSHELTEIHYLFFLDFLPFHLAYLSFAYYSFRKMCIFVCSCHRHSYEFSSSFHSFFG